MKESPSYGGKGDARAVTPTIPYQDLSLAGVGTHGEATFSRGLRSSHSSRYDASAALLSWKTQVGRGFMRISRIAENNSWALLLARN